MNQRMKLTALAAAAAVSITCYASWDRGGPVSAAAAVVPAQDGAALYEQHCMSCHGDGGVGSGKYPSLIGGAKEKSYDRAYSFISQNMPLNAPGTLKEDEYKAIVNYVLSLNGVATAPSDLDGYWAKDQINELFDRKIVDGYTDKATGKLLFKPGQPITRAEFVRYLVKAKELFLSNSDSTSLSDIDSLKGNKVYIITAVENGLIDGYADGTFKPGSPITRAEAAAVLTRSEMLQPAGTAEFKDVPADHWASGAIAAVRQARLFDGYENGSFLPDNKITRGEAASVLYRLVNPE